MTHPDGTTWVATQEAAFWFDGYRWHPVALPDEFIPAGISELTVLPSGEVICLGLSKLARVSPEGSELLHHEPWSRHGIEAPEADGRRLLIRVDDQPVLWDIVTDEFTLAPDYPHKATVIRSWSGVSPSAIHDGFRIGRLGLDGWETLTEDPALSVIRISAFDPLTGDGLAWVPLPKDSRGLWTWRSSEPPEHVPVPDGLTVSNLALGPDGEALALLDNGSVLLRSHGDTRDWSVIEDPPRELRDARDLRFRSNGDLWSATKDGLHLLRKSGSPWATSLQYPAMPHRLNALAVEDGGNGTLWFGTSHGVLVVREDGSQQLWGPANHHAIEYCTALCMDRRGYLWAASGTGLMTSIQRFDGARWEDMSVQLEGLPRAPVHQITEDSSGRLWFLPLGVVSEDSALRAPTACYLEGRGRATAHAASAGLGYALLRRRHGELGRALLRDRERSTAIRDTDICAGASGRSARFPHVLPNDRSRGPRLVRPPREPAGPRLRRRGGRSPLHRRSELLPRAQHTDLDYDAQGTLWAVGARDVWSVRDGSWRRHSYPQVSPTSSSQ